MKNRADIRILYGERQTNVRSALRNTLISEGYKGIEDFAEVKPLASALTSGWPDLVVLDSGLPGGDCCALIVGFNPDKQAADMASEINGMLSNFAARSR